MEDSVADTASTEEKSDVEIASLDIASVAEASSIEEVSVDEASELETALVTEPVSVAEAASTEEASVADTSLSVTDAFRSEDALTISEETSDDKDTASVETILATSLSVEVSSDGVVEEVMEEPD